MEILGPYERYPYYLDDPNSFELSFIWNDCLNEWRSKKSGLAKLIDIISF